LRAIRRSILLKLFLLMTVIVGAVFLFTGQLLHRSISISATKTVEQEVIASFQAYEALWHMHTEQLKETSSVISRMADVRAALSTKDRATIQDTAGELWQHLSPGNALFTIADGDGTVLASVPSRSPVQAGQQLSFLQQAPAQSEQTTGFLQEGGRLYQVAVTPVFVDAEQGRALLNLLVAGFEVDPEFLRSLKEAAGGSEFIFELNGRKVASTLQESATLQGLAQSCQALTPASPVRIEADGISYLALNRPLATLLPRQTASLCLVRSLASSETALDSLLHEISNVWLAGFAVLLLSMYLVVRRMLRPVAALDKAASEIAAGNYGNQVSVAGEDEIGRLAGSFNVMSVSLERARHELIRHERLTAVARLATMVVHDLRNPLAAIYAGAEMMVDNELPSVQVKRLARNMYRASRGVIDILNELLAAARNKPATFEPCLLRDLVSDAWNSISEPHSNVRFDAAIPDHIEVSIDRAPMERVLHNLLQNSVEAIGSKPSGEVNVSASVSDSQVLVHFRDNGKGIHPDLRPILFQPFATHGSEQGLGLGLALSKETVRAHGGDLWADFDVTIGSHFILSLPVKANGAPRSYMHEK
jgi:signal transduction histidine kinase